MIKQANLGYETEALEMTTSTFDSIISNLGTRVGRTKVKITFQSQQQKNSYILSEQRFREREDEAEIISNEEEDINNEEDEYVRERKKVVDEKKQKINAEKREIPVSFEMSILLREKYFQELEKIGRRLEVRFMVVPNKVKIVGWKSDLVDEAEEEFARIQDKIRFVPVSISGRQIYQSKYYTSLLKENSIQMVKILNRYYCWFEQGCPDPTDILKDVLNTTKHAMIPLHDKTRYAKKNEAVERVDIVHGEQWVNEWKHSVIFQLSTRIKATIFEEYIQKQINRLETRMNRQIEISEDKKDLILHLDAEEQITIIKKAIKDLYQPFTYTFLVFDRQIPMEEVMSFFTNYSKPSQSFKKNKKGNKQTFFFEVIHNFVCLSFMTKEDKQAEAAIEEHDLMKLFKAMPPKLLNFKLAVQSQLQAPEEEQEFKKFMFQRDFMEKVTYINLKNPSPKNYERLFQLYLQNKFDQEYRIKQQSLDNAKNQITQQISIGMSRPVDESSLMFNNTLNNSLLPAQEQSMIKILPDELSNSNQPVFRFENYTFNLRDRPEEREKRYTDKVVAPKRSIISFTDPEYEQEIKAITKSKFKLHRITVPLKYKQISIQAEVQKILALRPELAIFNREVTVFYGGKEPKDHENIYSEDKTIKVLRMGDNHNIREGYLLRTNIAIMFVEFELKKNTVQLPYGKYEALCFFKKVD